jgi:hypothetical protein
MSHTDLDEKTIIAQQKKDIALLNGQLLQMHGEQATRERALTHVRVAMDEAVAMATRFAALPVGDGDKVGARRRNEANRLVAFFRECKRNFEDTLSGGTPAIAEKVVVDEQTQSPGNYTRKVEVEWSAGEEPKGDSGETAVGVDSTGGAEEQ